MNALSSVGNSASARNRVGYFIAMLCILILATASLVVYMVLDKNYTDLQNETERRLTEQVQARVAMVAQATGGLRNQARTFVNTDLLRLFTYEVYTAADESLSAPLPPPIPVPAPAPLLDENGSPLNGTDPAVLAPEPTPSSPQALLQQQLPVMRKQLANFARDNLVLQASLVTSSQKIVLSSQGKPGVLKGGQLGAVKDVLDTGQPKSLPLYVDESGRLVEDAFFPIFAPLYITEKADQPVGAFFVTSDMGNIVTSLPARNMMTGEQWRILQKNGNTLQEIVHTKNIELASLPHWQLVGDALPFGLRAGRDGSRVYSLGLPVSDSPLVVCYEILQDYVDESYQTYKKNLILLVGACLVCAFLCIGMAWWWLMGQREKAVTVELHSLYRKVNAQKLLLDRVNSAVADGIVMKDLTGKIGYSNDAFGKMAGKPADAVVGEYFDSIISNLSTSHSIHPMSTTVLETGEPTTYTESLHCEGQRREYQVVATPLKDDNGNISDIVVVYRDVSELVAMHDKSQYVTHQMVSVLVRSLETVDPYLSGHSMLAAELAQHLVRALKLDFTCVSTVRAAASLSQLGMLQLPTALRTKVGALTAAERMQMEQHVVYTQKMLKSIDFGMPVQQAIGQMFEGMDGSGYPLALKGDEICLEARILSVANTFCALMRPRAYRQAMDVEKALTILSPTAPRYDPVVVTCLHEFLASTEGQEFMKRFAPKT